LIDAIFCNIDWPGVGDGVVNLGLIKSKGKLGQPNPQLKPIEALFHPFRMGLQGCFSKTK
jgi:hypothetical protein